MKTKIANLIKAELVKMAIADKLPSDLTTLDVGFIEKFLDPIEDVLYTVRKDAEMALNDDWDTTTDEGKEGFQCQIDLINKVLG